MNAYGRELRRIAEEFERSRLSRDSERIADQIPLVGINRRFRDLLDELFQNGVTSVKVVTLIFFCINVAKRATRELAIKLMSRSFSYVIDTAGSAAHHLGRSPIIMISCWAALGIVGLIVYIHGPIPLNA